ISKRIPRSRRCPPMPSLCKTSPRLRSMWRRSTAGIRAPSDRAMRWSVAWLPRPPASAPYLVGMSEPAAWEKSAMSTRRPADVCRQLLATLDASEGRRKRRKRNTTPDAIGLAMKRDLLAAVVQDDPEPAAFESWLVGRCQASGIADGPMRAMALE